MIHCTYTLFIYRYRHDLTHSFTISFTGIATHYIPSERLPALEERLIDLETSEHEIIQKVLEKFIDKKAKTDKIGYQRDIRETIDR